MKHADLVIVKFLLGQGLQVTDMAVNLALSRGSKNIIDELVFNWTGASRKAITKHAVRFSKKGDFRWLNNTIFMRALLAVPQNQMKKILAPHLEQPENKIGCICRQFINAIFGGRNLRVDPN